MEKPAPFIGEVLSASAPAKGESGLLSTESVLNLQKLIFPGSPLSEVLTNIAQLVESQAAGMSCTIWLPDEDGKELYCAAAPSLAGFIAQAGSMSIGPKGGSCGTAVYGRAPVYATDVLTDLALPCEWMVARSRAFKRGTSSGRLRSVHVMRSILRFRYGANSSASIVASPC
jgi:formate hydrogenlyase transcriptional activator